MQFQREARRLSRGNQKAPDSIASPVDNREKTGLPRLRGAPPYFGIRTTLT
jgi:hypothetical protein